MADVETVEAAELMDGFGVTYAALVLLGHGRSVTRLLGQAEVIFEYRSDEASIPAQQRQNYRRGFLGFFDDLWNEINRRNERVTLPAGMLRTPIFAFREDVVREAILNAVAHREYRAQESVFIRHFPYRLEVERTCCATPEAGRRRGNGLWRLCPDVPQFVSRSGARPA